MRQCQNSHLHEQSAQQRTQYADDQIADQPAAAKKKSTKTAKKRAAAKSAS